MVIAPVVDVRLKVKRAINGVVEGQASLTTVPAI